MTKVRMLALQVFTKNLDNRIIHAHPKHPDEEGRYVTVSEGAAAQLENEGLAKRFSLKDQAKWDAEQEDENNGVDDVDGTTTAGTAAAETAQKARERRTDTSGKEKKPAKRAGAAKAAPATPRRRAPAKGKAPAAGEVGGAPVGGNETNASTNHAETAVNGSGMSDDTNAGASGDPADAAPTE